MGYTIRMRRVAVLIATSTLLLPLLASASPFGGQASLVHYCLNNAIIAYVGAPIGGAYIWTPATRTYKNGAPTHGGQWLLGLYGAPYYCIYSRVPVDVRSGLGITILGTSQ